MYFSLALRILNSFRLKLSNMLNPHLILLSISFINNNFAKYFNQIFFRWQHSRYNLYTKIVEFLLVDLLTQTTLCSVKYEWMHQNLRCLYKNILLFQMFASATTYMVILLQFQNELVNQMQIMSSINVLINSIYI